MVPPRGARCSPVAVERDDFEIDCNNKCGYPAMSALKA
jgi:hypothetical protein